MNSFVSKYKNKMGGMSGKQQKKEDRKSVTKALHDTFKYAMNGQVAGIQHEGQQYLMMRQDIFNDIIKNGGKVLLTEEQKSFHAEYQILLNMMQSLNIEDENESALFDEIDQFTFDFSQIINDPNAAKQRRAVEKEFHEVIASSEVLTLLEKNLRKQLFPTEEPEKEVENNGKLT